MKIDPKTKVGGVEIGQLAGVDPFLAAALLPGFIQPDQIGVCEPRCGWGWEIINIVGCFNSGAIQTVTGIVCDIDTDLWIRKVMYTVSRPNAFPGNIFKAQSDHFNSLNPNIDFTLAIKSYCHYLISPDPTPLENIAIDFECVCPVNFLIGCNAVIRSEFTNRREFATDEVPVQATITFHAIRLPTSYQSCLTRGYTAVLRELTERGAIIG